MTRVRQRSAPKPASPSASPPESAPQAATTGKAPRPPPRAKAARKSRPAPLPKVLLGPVKATLNDADAKDLGPAQYPKAVASVPVKSARVMEFQGLKNTGDPAAAPTFLRSTDVSFGTLSRPQFDALHQEFGGRSQVPYDAGREYNAIDFLPPAVQALVNRDVDVGQPVELKGTAKLRDEEFSDGGDFSISLDPNCHGTAWEAMRAFQGRSDGNVSITFGEPQVADAQLSTGSQFTELGKARAGQVPDFLDKLQPGDVVAFHKFSGDLETDLLHTTVYAGGGLFFEKPNTEMDEDAETPYRLATWDQVKAPILTRFNEERLGATAFHPAVPLPSTHDTFVSEYEAPLAKWAKSHGSTLGKPLGVVIHTSLGGGTTGIEATAMDVKKLQIGPDGRGVLE